MLTARRVGKDMNEIFKSEMKTAKKSEKKRVRKLKVIKNVQKKIEKYYTDQQIDSNCLIKRLGRINFGLYFTKTIMITVIFGLITGLCTSFVLSIIEEIHLENILAVTVKLNSFIMWVRYGAAIIFAFAAYGVLMALPCVLFIGYGYIASVRMFKDDLDIFILEYEKQMIIRTLEEKYNLDMSYLKKS